MDNLHEWSLKMQGAREMLLAIIESVNDSRGKFLLDGDARPKLGEPKGAGKMYHEAIVRLILSNLDNTQKFLMKKPIGYRNFEHDKKGRLIRCEAYFMK